MDGLRIARLACTAALVGGGAGCVVLGTHEACASAYPHCSAFEVNPDDVIANTDVPLRREYWATARRGDRAYLFPRPDGVDTLAAECRAGGPRAPLLARNALCTPATTEEEVARVNGMTVEDALAVSTFLHEHLRFRRVPGTTDITPFPYVDDELGVCDESPGARAGVLRQVCDRAYRARGEGYPELVARAYTEAEAEALPPLLDRLYGVTP